MKAILLAGGSGTRLYPLTQVMTKQLQAVYDKPMIYYPLTTLMLGGIRDILIISTPIDLPRIKGLLGDGGRWGIRFQYAVQEKPEGIAQAFIIGEDFIAGDRVVLILGDNIFYGYYNFLRDALKRDTGAVVFGYYVNDPMRYGVVEVDGSGRAIGIEEKPVYPKSNYAVTGLYIYDGRAAEMTKSLRLSGRGELEITDLNMAYLREAALQVEIIGRGIAWLDAGTPDSMLEAANFISTIEKRQGLKFGCPEEAALRMGFIDEGSFENLIAELPASSYQAYLERIMSLPVKTWDIAK